jgi:hypothetical protein
VSGDDLAAALYAEQGAHFVATDQELPSGHIVSCDGGGYPMTTPLRIVALGTQEDFDRQHDLSVKITGDDDSRGYRRRKYVYRVEAAD